MKNLFIITFLVLSYFLSDAQKTATFDQVGNKKVRGNLVEYTTESGAVFKLGDTLVIGYPFRQDCFAHITNRSNQWSAALAGTACPPLTTTSSGSIAVIKMMKATQRKLYVTTYAQGESVGVNIVNFEEAFKTGEIILQGYLTSSQALTMLKEEKDKLDLGLISQEQYDIVKRELSKYIK